MSQDRLFRLAVESGAINFRHVPGRGWTLVIQMRRGDEDWREAQADIYEGLSTMELIDTVCTCLDITI